MIMLMLVVMKPIVITRTMMITLVLMILIDGDVNDSKNDNDDAMIRNLGTQPSWSR